jgi:hypothetical protein
MQPVIGGKRRSPKPDVLKATKGALARSGRPEDIRAGCRAYYALPDCTKDGGAYAKGAAVLLNADRWREYLPGAEAVRLEVDVSAWTKGRWRAALEIHRETGQWGETMGPKPGLPGCRAPPELLVEFGLGNDRPKQERAA